MKQANQIALAANVNLSFYIMSQYELYFNTKYLNTSTLVNVTQWLIYNLRVMLKYLVSLHLTRLRSGLGLGLELGLGLRLGPLFI